MSSKTPQNPKPKVDPAREARLKAALKANMAKRKAQARAKSAAQDGQTAQKQTKE